jgi:hypothetical protein
MPVAAFAVISQLVWFRPVLSRLALNTVSVDSRPPPIVYVLQVPGLSMFV